MSQMTFESAASAVPAMDDPSWVRRAMLIEQLAVRYRLGELGPPQRCEAEDAFRVALYDGEPLVRCVLADSLKRAGDLPRDIIRKLAQDEAQVARPVLQYSPLLSDEDLIRIAREGGRSRGLAIAERSSVSPRVAEALYGLRDPFVLRRLLANDGAVLPEGMLHAILASFGAQPDVVETMAHRRILPASVANRLASYGLPEDASCERRLAG